MLKVLDKFKESRIRDFLLTHKNYAPLVFFTCGFIFDTLTLGRIDRLYDVVILSLHISFLTMILYLYNVVEDGKWRETIIYKYKSYLPLAVQFYFGALASAYVIYFSRSVSLSRTIPFFIILILLLVANEFLKKKIANKYLQFSIYYFINLTFCTFMLPVFIKKMNTFTFICSGLISLIFTLAFIYLIYIKSPSTRAVLSKKKIISLILFIYFIINLFYYFNLIPPVPLALENGIVAHSVSVQNGIYNITYEPDKNYIFWRDHHLKFHRKKEESVYIFTSIFAPTHINKSVVHRWNWYNSDLDEWQKIEDISYDMSGGRDEGYRGYTYKNNVKEGEWKVEVITKEELILGIVFFEIIATDIDDEINQTEMKI